jgi:hypothetical protein
MALSDADVFGAPAAAGTPQTLSYADVFGAAAAPGAQAASPATPAPSPLAAAGKWWLRNTLALPQGARDVWNSASQMVEHAFPALARADQALGAPTADQVVQNQEADYGASRAALGGTGTDWMRDLGRAGPAIAASSLAPGASPWLMGPALGAISGALTPITKQGGDSPSYGQQVGTNTAVGGVTGLAGPILSKTVAPTISAGARSLLNSGVRLTPGQMLGGAWQRIEQGATSLPFVGDLIKNSLGRANQDLNTVVINRALQPIGATVPKGATGNAAIDAAHTAVGDAYDKVIDNIGAAPVDGQLVSSLQSLQSLTQNLPKDMGDQFSRVLQNEIFSRISAGTPSGVGVPATITGEGLKVAESNLGKLARGYMRDPDVDKQTMGTAVAEAQNTIRDWLGRVSPQNAAQLQSINSSYAQLMRPTRAAGYVGAPGGVFNPEQLYSAVKAEASSPTQFSRGNALMQPLAKTAKDVMGSKVPDSGTPFRSAAMLGAAGLLGHGTMAGPAIAPAAVGMGLASLPYTRLGNWAARGLIAGAPQTRAALARPITPLLSSSLPGFLFGPNAPVPAQ